MNYELWIDHVHIDHNAPFLPTPPPPPTSPTKNKLDNHCFQFLLGITVVPREIKDNGYVKFGGVNNVHYGLFKNGEYNFLSIAQ